MNPHSETAALTGSIVRSGGDGISKAVTAENYRNPTEIATFDYAASKVAGRFRLSLSTAREICRMAGLAVRP
jgi:hypothetical protein